MWPKSPATLRNKFLLTPLREGRLREEEKVILCRRISTHAPAGGATALLCEMPRVDHEFLLTPLREGRHSRRRR